MDKPSISEKELLAMPAKQYMNEAQLEFFRDRLVALNRAIDENASATGEHLRDSELLADPADRASKEEEHAIELRTRDRERKLQRKIEQALRRIEDGSYGYCEETGEPIGLKRLLARPTATLTIDAQERREKLERVYGG